MSDRINLEDRARNAISEALYGMDTYDARTLRDALEDRASEEADSACIYHHHCAQIIQDYERDYPAEDMGGTYTAEQWQEAQTAYAYGVAYAALSAMIEEHLTAIDAAAEALADTLDTDYPDAPAPDRRISADCPHGWAPHDREDDEGVHHWSPAHLEGCHAIAVEVSGVWVSYTWTVSGRRTGDGMTAQADARFPTQAAAHAAHNKGRRPGQ